MVGRCRALGIELPVGEAIWALTPFGCGATRTTACSLRSRSVSGGQARRCKACWNGPDGCNNLDMIVSGDLVSASTAVMQDALGGDDRDWSVAAGDLDWSCRETAVHVADDLFSYASQVVAQPSQGYLPIEVSLEPAAEPASLLRCVVMCGELLRLAVSSAASSTRAWHPYGTSDPEGFAAMGVTEVLVHTYDIARGLDIVWVPPPELSEPVLLRLFPRAPSGDPSEVLLWCTGRVALTGRLRQTQWRWDSSVQP